MSEHRFRCGDAAIHKPSGETWVVAWADYESGYLAWLGWPKGEARIDDFELSRAATDAQYLKQVADILDRVPPRGDRLERNVRRLYRPAEFRRMEREARDKEIAGLKGRLAQLEAVNAAEDGAAAEEARLVTVCATCLRAGCFQGKLYCDDAVGSDVKKLPVSDLRKLGREHPDTWKAQP